MKKKKLNMGRVLVVFIILILIITCLSIGVFFYELSPANENGKEETYTVENGKTVYEIYEDLENKKIIKSALFMKIYSKIIGIKDISAGNYIISSNMSARKIYDILISGGSSNRETTTITFKEGRNIRDFIELLENNTNIKKDEILEKLNDTNYLEELIDKYWFLTDEIKNKDIYYSLEGYIFPNT